MARRALLDQFQLPNVGYIGCTVTFYTADATGAATAVKATLYDDLTGSGTLLNPQTFNSEGALPQPTYIDVAVVPVVAGAHVVSQTLGVVCPPGGYRGDWATATLYLPGDWVTDGTAGGSTNEIYAVINFHLSGVWATDGANANKLKKVSDFASLSIAPDATESVKGKAEIATQAETNTGTDDLRFITPKKYKDATAVPAGVTTAIAAAIAAIPAPPSFSANKNSVNQTGVTSATLVKVTATTEDWDIGGYYDAANSKFLPLVAGKYLICGAVFFNAANIVDQAAYQAAIFKNGALYKGGDSITASGTGGLGGAVSCVVDMNGTTDYVELFCFGGGAGAKTVSGDPTLTWFQAVKVA